MSDVQRFWCHEASNILCVRASDFDRVAAERDALQQLLNEADQRIDDLERGSGEVVATVLCPDPYDERSGAWFSSQDLRRLESLPAGTKLYTAPQAPVSTQPPH